tara:strand:+ start:386 stop:610 length:225 start_codon:yes stop_codon:yes gene_type:complete
MFAGNTAKSNIIVIVAPNFRLLLKNNITPIITSTIPLMKTNSFRYINDGGTNGIKKSGLVKWVIPTEIYKIASA